MAKGSLWGAVLACLGYYDPIIRVLLAQQAPNIPYYGYETLSPRPGYNYPDPPSARTSDHQVMMNLVTGVFVDGAQRIAREEKNQDNWPRVRVERV